MAPSWWIVCLVALLALPSPLQVAAQILQDYTTSKPSYEADLSDNQYWYKPRPGGGNPEQVINLRPRIVWLVYNCFYMRNICKNVENFYATQRGKRLHPVSGLPNDIFGYDFYTGKHAKTHSSLRREQSCPTKKKPTWNQRHPCPEDNQRTVMRHDGPWWTTSLEPLTTMNEIMHLPLGLAKLPSNMRYTCDEFPPATWVEGGRWARRHHPRRDTLRRPELRHRWQSGTELASGRPLQAPQNARACYLGDEDRCRRPQAP